MPEPAQWSLFLTATIILLVIPGPSVLFVVSRGIDQGFRAAVFSAVGLALGDLFQVLCAAVGLSTLLASSIALFTTVKYAGAAYLIFLGLQRFLEKDTVEITECTASQGGRSGRTLIMQGFSVNALNPKTALFFLALLPQFVNPGSGPAWLQTLLLGGAFVALGLVTNTAYGRMGGKLGSLAKRSQRFRTATRYVGGGTLMALGATAAFAPASQGHFRGTR